MIGKSLEPDSKSGGGNIVLVRVGVDAAAIDKSVDAAVEVRR
jgi:hypothetical protein